ncbi:MAG: hypothetical protein LCH43_01175 [Actinobacteria bacterium]|nr:hypothetical protein [Actinomycetota bacterium]
MPVDPLLSLVVGAFGAAVIGVVGALLGAWIQSRREHSRWLRELRVEAYGEFLRLVNLMPSLAPTGGKEPSVWHITGEANLAAFHRDQMNAVSTIALLGPEDVEKAAYALLVVGDLYFAALQGEGETPPEIAQRIFVTSRSAFVSVSRKSLGITRGRVPADAILVGDQAIAASNKSRRTSAT